MQAWLAQVQFQAEETARAHAVAKDVHKQVCHKILCFALLCYSQWPLLHRLALESNLLLTMLRVLRQVDAERAAAREVYRKEQHSTARQNAWKGKVLDLKRAQADLKLKREAYYRSAVSICSHSIVREQC